MKTLLLLRHAKSSWDDSTLRDFDRPLAQRGLRDAPAIGHALKDRGPLPEFVISSPAARARETAEAFITAASLDLSPQFDESIYAASSAELMKVVRRLPDAASCALMVGHNPGFEDLLFRLTSVSDSMPTAALACIEFNIEHWEDVEDKSGKLAWLLTPKTLNN